MRISVALCTFNGADYLHQQLQSIAGQERLPDEVVVRDDSSTDDSVEVVRQFADASGIPTIVRVNPSRLGAAANFASAVSECSGDVIALADQDDVWLPSRLSHAVRTFEDSNVGMVFTNASLVDHRLAPLGLTAWEAAGFSPSKQAQIRRGEGFPLLIRSTVVVGATMAFRSSLCNTILPLPPIVGRTGTPFYHDGWIAAIAAATTEIRAEERPLLLYRQHAGQAVGLRPAASVRLARAAIQGSDRRTRASAMLEWLCALDDRLASADAAHRWRVHLWRAIEHFGRRASLDQGRVHRILPVANELLSGGYHRHSGGLGSAVADLLIR